MYRILNHVFTPFLFLVMACSLPQEPKLPQWQVTLQNIPLLAPDTLIIGEEFSDSSLIVDDDSLYHLWFTGGEQIELAQHLRLEPLAPEPISGILNEVRVEGNPGQSVHVALFEALPELQVYNNTSGVVPEQTIRIVKALDLDNFCSVTLSQGLVGVNLINNLPFDLGAPINITIYDRERDEVVSSFEFNQSIAANGGQQVAQLDLSGKTLTNALQVIIEMAIPGTQGHKVYLSEDLGFEVSVSMSDLVAVAAEAKIPPQTLTFQHQLDLTTDSLVIASAEIAQGSLTFNIANEFSLPVRLNMTLPGVLDGDRKSYNHVFDLFSEGQEQIVIDLSGKTVQMLNGFLQIDVIATLLPESEDYVRVHAGDNYRFSAQVSELSFTNVTASVDLYTDFPSIEEEVMDTEVNIPEILFEQAEFILLFRNVPANMQLDLNLDAVTGSNEQATAAYQMSIPGGLERRVRITNNGVFVDGAPCGTGGGLMDVINLFPKRFAFSGNARIRDNYVTLNGAPIDMDYQLDVPFVFSVPENTVLTGDTSKIDMDEEQRDNLDNVNNLQLNADIANGLGLGGIFSLRVADVTTARQLDITDWTVLTQVDLAAAATDAQGNRISLNRQQLSVNLTEEQIDLIAASDYMTWTMELEPVPMARLKSTDFVVLEGAYLSGDMTVNGGDE